MSDMNPNPPPLPAVLTSAAAVAASQPGSLPLGEDPRDCEPIRGPLAAVEAVLRHPRRILYQLHQPRSGNLILALLLIAVFCSIVYGVVVGTFSGGVQLWAAPVKIAAGLVVSALICLPSLYIFSCLSGSQARLVEVFGLLAGLLALTTVLLIGFAPVAWVLSESTQSLAAISEVHLAFW